MIGDINNLLEQEEGNQYKSVKVGNLYSNNYIEYEISGYRKKNLPVKEYLDETKSYSKDILNKISKNLIYEKFN